LYQGAVRAGNKNDEGSNATFVNEVVEAYF